MNASAQKSLIKSIELCCTWDEQIYDGVLKYKLINMQEEQRNEIREAFDSWNSELSPSLKLIETQSIHEKPEIIVTFGDIDNGNTNQFVENVEAGQIAGQSANNLNQEGLITNATIILSNEIFIYSKSDSNALFSVVLHEIGHVLGLGHANFDDLMNPVVSSDMDEVSLCDANGVIKANRMAMKKEEALQPIQANLDTKNTVDC